MIKYRLDFLVFSQKGMIFGFRSTNIVFWFSIKFQNSVFGFKYGQFSDFNIQIRFSVLKRVVFRFSGDPSPIPTPMKKIEMIGC